ncbi:MAG: tetratricopeptide repeat protein [Alphaproteobacteria bacterium]|nr:tetratricopeptide repeat protein [Alphaproteobacteria bacterium]
MKYMITLFTGAFFMYSPVQAFDINMTKAQLLNELEKQQEEIRQLRGELEVLHHQLSQSQSKSYEGDGQLPVTSSGKSADKKSSSTKALPKAAGSEKEQDSSYAYNKARTLLDQRNFDEAEILLTQFIRDYPKDPLLVNACYWLAETHYIRADYLQAAIKFGEAYEAYTSHKNEAYKEQVVAKGPEIMFKLASSLYNIGKLEDAKLTLEELSKEFPKLPANIRSQTELLRREISKKVKTD